MNRVAPPTGAMSPGDLVVIEAPGKIRTLHRAFAEIGVSSDVCATIGHFLENPRSLRDPAVVLRDGEFVETRRRPHRSDSYDHLCGRIRACRGRVLVATDNDQEGHVIAQDVAELVSRVAPGTRVLRVRLQSLDAPSVRAALQAAEPMDPSLAVPGTARRICDRLIGATLGDFRGGRPVGRVQSALLGLCARGVARGEVTVTMPCADGGKPFVASAPLVGDVSPADLIAALPAVRESLPAAPVAGRGVVAMRPPLSYADALLDMNEQLRMSISDAARLLQSLYESGQISYPRTAARGFSAESSMQIERQARMRGLIAFKRGLLPVVGDGSPHEAIRVTAEETLRRLDIARPLKLQGSERDAALALIARRSIEAGMPVQRDIPDLSGAPEWARSLRWARDTRVSVLTWRYPERAVVREFDGAAAMVRAMRDSGIGRPSTFADHAARFMERGLVDERLELTSKGREWLSAAPEALRHPSTSALVEEMLDAPDRSVGDLVRQVLELAAGDKATRDRVYTRLMSAGVDAVPAPVEEHAPSEGVPWHDAAMAKGREMEEDDLDERFAPAF